MKIFYILPLILAIISNAALANDGEGATSVLIKGLEVYSEKGSRAAIETWIKGSMLEGSKDALAQANMLNQVQDFYGNYEGYEIVSNNSISNRVHMITFLMLYEKGPVFGRFQSYKTLSNEWVATTFQFHTEASQVWPSHTIFGN